MIKLIVAVALLTPGIVFAQEQQVQEQSPIFFINREVPCASDPVVDSIHAELGLVPIATATNVNANDELGTIIILHNAETGKIAVELHSEEYAVTCNLISGDNFTLIN